MELPTLSPHHILLLQLMIFRYHYI